MSGSSVPSCGSKRQGPPLALPPLEKICAAPDGTEPLVPSAPQGPPPKSSQGPLQPVGGGLVPPFPLLLPPVPVDAPEPPPAPVGGDGVCLTPAQPRTRPAETNNSKGLECFIRLALTPLQ